MKQVWKYPEGRLYVVQAVLTAAPLAVAVWVYYAAFYRYTPAPGQTYRCATGEMAALFMLVLLGLYELLWWRLQAWLLRRRERGRPLSAWAGVVFLASLLPVGWWLVTG